MHATSLSFATSYLIDGAQPRVALAPALGLMTTTQDGFDAQDLLQGFQSAGGYINTSIFGLKPFSGMGYGAVALRDVPAGQALFTVPNRLILSGYATDLPGLLTPEETESLGHGWARLILVMMVEESRGESSRWGWYLRNLPKRFETPMFWKNEDLIELKGTDIESRIGRADAEEEYRSKIVPILQAHPDIFPLSSPHFTLEAYHLQGSRILSRSFTISHLRALRAAQRSPNSPNRRPADNDESNDVESEPEEWEEEDWDVPAMVTMADMLNAAYQRDNARLYDLEEYDPDDQQGMAEALNAAEGNDGYMMVSESGIKLGDQIFNTYDSPPNSELLRKYGHVDVFPLEQDILDQLEPEEVGDWAYGNPGDEVEIPGEIVVQATNNVREQSGMARLSEEDAKDRVEEWLDNGQEDSFNVTPGEIDPGLIAFSRILVHEPDWERFKKRGKLPKLDVDASVGGIISMVSRLRSDKYSRSLEDELRRLASDDLGPNHRRAAIVKVGEMRLLRILGRKARALVENQSSVKRKAELGEDAEASKRSRPR